MVFRCLSRRDNEIRKRNSPSASPKKTNARPLFPLHRCSGCSYTVCHSCFNYHYNIACQKSSDEYDKWRAKQTTSNLFPEIFLHGNRCPFCKKGSYHEVRCADPICESQPFECFAWNNVKDCIQVEGKKVPLYRRPYWTQMEPFASHTSECCLDHHKHFDIFLKGEGIRNSPQSPAIIKELEERQQTPLCIVSAMENSIVSIVVLRKACGKTAVKDAKDNIHTYIIAHQDTYGEIFEKNQAKSTSKPPLRWEATSNGHEYATIELRLPFFADHPYTSLMLFETSKKNHTKHQKSLFLEIIPHQSSSKGDASTQHTKSLHSLSKAHLFPTNTSEKSVLSEFQTHGNLALWRACLQSGQNLLFYGADGKRSAMDMIARVYEVSPEHKVLYFDTTMFTKENSESILAAFSKLLQSGYSTDIKNQEETLPRTSARNVRMPYVQDTFLDVSWLCKHNATLRRYTESTKAAKNMQTDIVVVVRGIDEILSYLLQSNFEAAVGLFHSHQNTKHSMLADGRYNIQWIWTISCPLSSFLPFIFDNLGHIDIFHPSIFGVFNSGILGNPKCQTAPFSVFDLSTAAKVYPLNTFGLHLDITDRDEEGDALEESAAPTTGPKHTGVTVLVPTKPLHFRPQHRPDAQPYKKRSFAGIVEALSDNLLRFLHSMLSIYFEKGNQVTQSIRVQMIRDGMRAKGFFQPDKELTVLGRELKTHGALTLRNDVYTFTDPNELWKSVKDRAERANDGR